MFSLHAERSLLKHSMEQQQEKLRLQIAGYQGLRARLEEAVAKFEEEKLTFELQKVSSKML